jgi:toxin ParE1/3/4
MNRFKLSAQAAQDIEDIWNYIAQESLETADTILDNIQERFPILAKFPLMGREREDIAPHIRSFPVGKYVIFYRINPGSIEVLRVIYGARDIQSLFE